MSGGSTASATVRDGNPAALNQQENGYRRGTESPELWPPLGVRPRIDRVFGVAARPRRGQMGN